MSRPEAVRFEYRCPLLNTNALDERGMVSVPVSIIPEDPPLEKSLKRILKDSFCSHRECRLDCEIQNITRQFL